MSATQDAAQHAPTQAGNSAGVTVTRAVAVVPPSTAPASASAGAGDLLEVILDMWEAGATQGQISAATGMTGSMVSKRVWKARQAGDQRAKLRTSTEHALRNRKNAAKAVHERVQIHKPKTERKCLRCQRMFGSRHPKATHRICDECARLS